MAVMLAFLAGAVAAGTAAVLTPTIKVPPLRNVLVNLLATFYRANDMVFEATTGVRKEFTALIEEGKAKAKVPPAAKPVTPPGPAVKVV